MKITEIRTTPLKIPYLTPYHWAQGSVDGAVVILVEVHTEQGLIGYGECIGTPSASAGQVFAGIEMALWDVIVKATGRAVHELLGVG